MAERTDVRRPVDAFTVGGTGWQRRWPCRGPNPNKTGLESQRGSNVTGMRIAVWGPVTNTKQLVRDALAGFLLGVLVVSAVALVTWTTRPAAAEAR